MPKVKLDFYQCGDCLSFERSSNKKGTWGYCREHLFFRSISGKPCNNYTTFQECEAAERCYELVDNGEEYLVR